MKAVILAGGKGTRLGLLTASMPKPLVVVGGKPVLEHQILLLKKHGIMDIRILTGHLGSKIAECVGDGSRWGVSVVCIQEEEPQGTAGALRALRGSMKEDFLLLSGDVMVAVDVNQLMVQHQKSANVLATVVVRDTATPLHSDLVRMDEAARIQEIFLRPHHESAHSAKKGIASLYILSPRFLEFIPSQGTCDIEKDIFPRVLQAGGILYGYYTQEYIRDMGTPDRLGRVQTDYENGSITI